MTPASVSGFWQQWNPVTVMREHFAIQARKRAGWCPVCDHGMHRDGPCGICGSRCRYPESLDAAQDRFAEARAHFRATVRRDLSPHVFVAVLLVCAVVIIIGAFTWGPWEFVAFAAPLLFIVWMMSRDLRDGA